MFLLWTEILTLIYFRNVYFEVLPADHLLQHLPNFPLPSVSLNIKSFFMDSELYISKIFQFACCFQYHKYHLLWMQYQDCWWWTVYLSETCRILYQNKVEKYCMLLASVVSAYHDAQSAESQIEISHWIQICHSNIQILKYTQEKLFYFQQYMNNVTVRILWEQN